MKDLTELYQKVIASRDCIAQFLVGKSRQELEEMRSHFVKCGADTQDLIILAIDTLLEEPDGNQDTESQD